MDQKKVAIVTNVQNPVGLAIVKGLCLKYPKNVFVTVPREKLEKEMKEKLKIHHLKAEVFTVDTCDKNCVQTFCKFLEENSFFIDVLVNIPVEYESKEASSPTYEEAQRIIAENYKSLVFTEELYSRLINGARVVNVTDACGHISNVLNKKWRQTLQDPDLTKQNIDAFVEEYLDSVKISNLKKEQLVHGCGAKNSAKKVARVAVAALTFVQQRKYAAKGISINAVHPGSLEMYQNPDDIASAPLYLIFNASPNLRGTFMWHNKKLVDWYDADGEYSKDCENS